MQSYTEINMHICGEKFQASAFCEAIGNANSQSEVTGDRQTGQLAWCMNHASMQDL